MTAGFLTHRRAVALMVLVAFMWSMAGVVTRQLESARSFEVTFWRSFFTMLSLVIILPLWRGRAVFASIRTGGAALWLSGVCWSVMFTAFMVAMTLTSVANVLVTMAIGPLLTALMAWVFIGHRVAARTWLAIAVAGSGIAWMFAAQLGVQQSAGPQNSLFIAAHSPALMGTLVSLLVPFAAASNWTLVQHSRQHGSQVDMVPAVLVGAVLSSMITLPLALPFAATVHDVTWLAGLGLFQLAIPCALSVVCAGVLKAPEVALLGLLEVIFGIVLAWLGAGEVPSVHVITGGILVIAALLGNEWVGWHAQKRVKKRVKT